MKERYSLLDGIHILPNFKPRFLQPLSTNQDVFDPLVDAARDESPVVEKASTEALAAPRRSDKPELECPAALTQQTDRVIRTRRAACSSRKK